MMERFGPGRRAKHLEENPRSHYRGTWKSKKALIIPKSITRKDFPDYEKLDSMTAAAVKRCYDMHTLFRKKIGVEEQRAQKDNRFLRGSQIAYLVHEYFRSMVSSDEIQGSVIVFNIKLENDDIQDIDLRWEQSLLFTSDPPSDNVIGGIYVT